MENQPSKVVEINPKKAKLNRYLSFLAQDQNNIPLLSEVLGLAIDLKDYETAFNLINQYETVPENDPNLNAMFGHIQLCFQDYGKSVQALTKALSAGVSSASLILDLAQCHYFLQRPETTQEILEQHKEIRQEHPDIFCLLLARAHYAQGNVADAISLLDDLHEDSNSTAESAGLLALLLFEEEREPERAMFLATSALELDEQALEARVARAMLHFEKHNYDDAEADINTALKYHPTSGRALSILAQLEFTRFQFEKAREAAKKACSYMNNHIGTWHLLGWSYIMTGMLDSALEAFKKSYDLDHRFFETHGGLAAVYAHKGETKKALNHINIAEKLNPNGFASTYARMILHNRNNEPEKATAIFKTATQIFDKRLGTTPQVLIDQRISELFPDKSDPTK